MFQLIKPIKFYLDNIQDYKGSSTSFGHVFSITVGALYVENSVHQILSDILVFFSGNTIMIVEGKYKF
jgi:hypothetical protein